MAKRRGENTFQAHRSHLYQRLVIAGYSHRTVTLLYSGLTLIGVALGMAWFAGVPGSGVSILVLAPSLPVALLWFVNSRENQGQQVSTMLGPPASPSLPQ